MEHFIGDLSSSETNTTSSKANVTSCTAPSCNSASSGVQTGEEDSNYDRLTQMLPECFVSVKLEMSEDTCATEPCSNSVSFRRAFNIFFINLEGEWIK